MRAVRANGRQGQLHSVRRSDPANPCRSASLPLRQSPGPCESLRRWQPCGISRAAQTSSLWRRRKTNQSRYQTGCVMPLRNPPAKKAASASMSDRLLSATPKKRTIDVLKNRTVLKNHDSVISGNRGLRSRSGRKIPGTRGIPSATAPDAAMSAYLLSKKFKLCIGDKIGNAANQILDSAARRATSHIRSRYNASSPQPRSP